MKIEIDKSLLKVDELEELEACEKLLELVNKKLQRRIAMRHRWAAQKRRQRSTSIKMSAPMSASCPPLCPPQKTGICAQNPECPPICPPNVHLMSTNSASHVRPQEGDLKKEKSGVKKKKRDTLSTHEFKEDVYTKKDIYKYISQKGTENLPKKPTISAPASYDAWDSKNLDFWFNQIWDQYPAGRKLGKKAAFRSFRASVKTQNDFKRLCAALASYKSQIERDCTETKYIKHGRTFFCNWQDYAEDEYQNLTAQDIFDRSETSQFIDNCGVNAEDVQTIQDVIKTLASHNLIAIDEVDGLFRQLVFRDPIVIQKICQNLVKKAVRGLSIKQIIREIDDAEFIKFRDKFIANRRNCYRGLSTPDDVHSIKLAMGKTRAENWDKNDETFLIVELKKCWNLYKNGGIENISESCKTEKEGEKMIAGPTSKPIDFSTLQFSKILSDYKKSSSVAR